MSKIEHAEDLLIAARRGELSPPQERQLRMLLAASPENERLLEIGQAYDQLDTEGVEDEAWIERVCDTALAGASGLERPSASQMATAGEKLPSASTPPLDVRASVRPRRARIAAAVVLLVGVSAAASYWGARYGAESAPQSVRQSPVSPAAPTSLGAPLDKSETLLLRAPKQGRVQPGSRRSLSLGPTTSAGSAPETGSAAASGVVLSPIAPVSSAGSSAPTPKRSVTSAAARDTQSKTKSGPVTPALLFSKANQARREGHTNRAITLYQQLLSSHPQSSQATVSRLVTAQLYLRQARASAALELFRQYRRSNGPLQEEAWVGEAQALRALGNSKGERVVWRNFLKRFPDSVHSKLAERRLRD